MVNSKEYLYVFLSPKSFTVLIIPFLLKIKRVFHTTVHTTQVMKKKA